MTSKRKPTSKEQERLEKLLIEKVIRAAEDAQENAEQTLFAKVIDSSNLDPGLKKILMK